MEVMKKMPEYNLYNHGIAPFLFLLCQNAIIIYIMYRFRKRIKWDIYNIISAIIGWNMFAFFIVSIGLFTLIMILIQLQ